MLVTSTDRKSMICWKWMSSNRLKQSAPHHRHLHGKGRNFEILHRLSEAQHGHSTDSYPLSQMDKCIKSLGNAQVLSTFNANIVYWQVEVDRSDRDNTPFTSHHGRYPLTRMPFGLKTLLTTFQRVVYIILSSVNLQLDLAYFGDIVIFSGTLREQINHTLLILSLLKKHGVT